MKKKIFAAILVCAMLLMVIAPTTAFANWIQQSDGSWVYYDIDNHIYYADGIYTIDGKDYYFDINGKMLTGWIFSDWSGDWYYADSNGALLKGWKEIGGKWYYFEPDNHYMYSDGIYTIGSNAYYFASSGAMQTGWIKEVYYYDDGDTSTVWYYADSSGRLLKGWQNIGGKWYYFTDWYIMRSDGVYWVDEIPYYFYPSGEMGTGWIKKIYNYGDGYTDVEWYYANSSGALQNKWQFINGSWYYFDEYGFYMRTGHVKINDKHYAFDTNGRMITGWGCVVFEYGDGYSDATWYYGDSNGLLLSGWQMIGGKWYYFDPEYYYMYTGYGNIDGKVYMFDTNGAWTTTPGWLEIKNGGYSTWYYLQADGTPYMGWKQFGSVWYYFNTYTGSMASNGVYRINDKYYAFDANGAWITSNGWHKFSSPGGSADWIYMENGTICTGWKDIGGTWYYFSSPYGYMETGLVRIGGKLNSFASSGAWIGYAAPGWQRINDSWYYVEGSAGDLAAGWRTIGAYTYYFDTSSYYMYRSGSYTIGGKEYQFDYQGHLVS